MFEHIYITGVGIVGYVVFCVPLALIATWLIYRHGLRRLAQPTLQRAGMFVTASVLLSLPLWDVIAISHEAGKLCKAQAGLKVYRTVEAEGFLGGAIEYWSRYGFSYVESGGGDKMSRYTMKDGKVVHQRIQEFISRYQSKTGESGVVIAPHFSRSSDQVVDRQTGEILGELIVLSIYPGWLDNALIGLTGAGSGFSPWHCGDDPTPLRLHGLNSSDVVKAVLKPSKSIAGESK